MYATAVGQHQDLEIDDSGSNGTQLLGAVSGRSWLNLAGKVTYLTTGNIPFSLDTSSVPDSERIPFPSLLTETETKSPTRIIIETTVTAGAFLGVAAVAAPVAPVVGTIIVTAFALAGGIGIVFYATPVNLDEVDSLPEPGDPLPTSDPTDPQVIAEILDSLLEPEADPGGGGQCTPPPTPPPVDLCKENQPVEPSEINEEGFSKIERHLDDIIDQIVQRDGISRSQAFQCQKAERAMLERLRMGQRTSFDVEFYYHEILEADYFVCFDVLNQSDLEYNDAVQRAHLSALQQRGASGGDLFHPEVIQRFPDIFSSFNQSCLL
ncbi:MAG: hypothetical protein HC921_22215 [Synechococcaceae cyanobacterium SM2_3_1]|nr:hypothetical protein [Synechococcaceae cyanobacterium SM2_3_1]